MLKVLYVSPVAERGGLEIVLLNILKSLDHSRFAPTVVLLEDGPFVAEVRGTGTETFVIKSGRVRNVTRAATAVGQLARLMKRARIDVVHTLNAKAHTYGGLAAALCGLPCLYHLQGVPRLSLTRDGIVSLLSVSVPARLTIACSTYVADEFRRIWHSRRKVAVVHNGSMPWVSDGALPGVREEFDVGSDAPLIVMVTRLQRWKGVHVFVDAMAQVALHRPDARFLVVGGSLFGLELEYLAELRIRAERLGLGQRLTFVGHQAATARFFRDADAIVHASIEPEPFGMVLLEAMAARRPVVASDLGGPREIVVHGETGFLVPPNRADLLSQSLLTLIADADLRARMGEAAGVRFQTHFLASRMAGELQSIYTQLGHAGQSDGRPSQ